MSSPLAHAPVYRETVLAPLFAVVTRHHWRHLLCVNRAHAVMLAERDLLTAADAAAILGAIDHLEAHLERTIDTLEYDSAHEDFFFYVESELRARTGADVAGRLHTGRSRNDVDQTILRMALRERLLALGADLAALVGTVVAVARRHRSSLVVAYTHGQPAQPTTWGHYLGAFAELLLRDADRLLHAFSTVDRSAMGAAAITTTGFPIDRVRMAELLGFASVQRNAYGCIAACDYATESYAALDLLLLNIGRFVQDLGQWASFEVGHLQVPESFVQRSSIMPQKRNPVPIEHLRLLCSVGSGHCRTVLLAMHNTPFTDVNDNEHTVHEVGYAAFDAAHRVLALLERFVGAVTIDDAAVRRHIADSCITMTEVADSLVRSEGISFAQAHAICSRLARTLADRGLPLTELSYAAFAAAFHEAVGRPPTVSDAELRRFATPEHFIAVRDRIGGPAPAALDTAFE